MKAIVTGHSKGLGAALANALLSTGIPVLGLARTSSAQLLAAFPSLMAEVDIDLGDSAALARWLHSPALGHYLDDCSTAVVINNAGIVEPVGALSQQDPLQVAKAVALNIAAPLMIASAFVAATKGKQRRVLHISSGAGRSPYPGWSVYCATKAALDHHARAVALDAEAGVRICSLAPGVVDTGMQAAIRATPSDRFPLRQRFVDLKRGGQLLAPADCAAQVIAYVLSASFGDVSVDDLRNS